jgi:hypothetical protein
MMNLLLLENDPFDTLRCSGSGALNNSLALQKLKNGNAQKSE